MHGCRPRLRPAKRKIGSPLQARRDGRKAEITREVLHPDIAVGKPARAVGRRRQDAERGSRDVAGIRQAVAERVEAAVAAHRRDEPHGWQSVERLRGDGDGRGFKAVEKRLDRCHAYANA